MIEIKKVSDIALAKKICEDNQVIWRPEYHVIATLDGETVLQCAVFSYCDSRGEIHAITCFEDDINFLDGLCRAILNIMDINGVKDVYLPLKYQKLAQYVGFKAQDSSYHLNLEGFFQCGCCHNHKEEEK